MGSKISVSVLFAEQIRWKETLALWATFFIQAELWRGGEKWGFGESSDFKLGLISARNRYCICRVRQAGAVEGPKADCAAEKWNT